MGLFSLKSRQLSNANEDLEAYRDITDDVIESDFVPYACYYNDHTLITKNGELMQVVKITGLAQELLGHSEVNLRATLREIIAQCIPSDSYALWLHTIRRKADLSSGGKHANEFARHVDEAWEDRNGFRHQYINEIYLSIVHEGQDVALRKPQNFVMGLLPNRDIRWRNAYLDETYDKINAVVGDIVEKLSGFGITRLGMYEHEGTFYCEISEFLQKLTNLDDRPMAAMEEDLSSYLTQGEITFGFNAMEVRLNERRRFASILTIKEHKEASLDAIDAFLQMPMEFIVTQYVNFIHPDVALDQYLDQKLLTDLSADEKLFKLSEVEDILKENAHARTGYGEQQLTVFVIADSIKHLERNVRKAVDQLFAVGIVTVREDLRFEQCYWAQLPGNFEFVKRTTPNTTSRIAGFANMHNFPVGKAAGNYWGHAVTTFHTASGMPYFFNFHRDNVGHTSIIGPEGSGKMVLANFLITQSMKFNPQLIYFDVTGSTPSFMEHLGGHLCRISATGEDAADAPMNPFSLPDNPENREFLSRWLMVLLRMAGTPIDDAQKAQLRDALEATFALPQQERTFGRFIAALADRSPQTAGAFSAWTKGGKYGHVFTHDIDAFQDHPNIIAFDMREVLPEQALLVPVFSYLLQRSMGEFQGSRPGILMLDEAWTLLKHAHVSGNIRGWLERLTQNNTLAILATEDFEEAAIQPFNISLLEAMATQLYLPNDEPSDEYEESFGLNELELAYLEAMDKGERHFLIKRGQETVVGELNLNGMDDILSALTGAEFHDTDNTEDLEIVARVLGAKNGAA